MSHSIIVPNGKFKRGWDLMMMMLVIYVSVKVRPRWCCRGRTGGEKSDKSHTNRAAGPAAPPPQVPYDVGFAPPPSPIIDGIEYMIDGIFVIDIVMAFFTAVVDTNARLITGVHLRQQPPPQPQLTTARRGPQLPQGSTP